jgi:3-phenylpropionate/trans-cinnamate dioxygenase ferredoxin subunit
VTADVARQLIGTLSRFPEGTLHRVQLEDTSLCVARTHDGKVYAISDRCSHENYSLSEGELLGFEVECPQHSSRFDLRSGAPSGLPAVIAVDAYPVTIDGSAVYVERD